MISVVLGSLVQFAVGLFCVYLLINHFQCWCKRNKAKATLLIGAHCVPIHSLLVYKGVMDLTESKLTFKQKLGILLFAIYHDLGYWHVNTLDDNGTHAEYSAKIWDKHAQKFWRYIISNKSIEYIRKAILSHSRENADKLGLPIGKACWADKMALRYEWRWFYLMRCAFTGELSDYRKYGWKLGVVPLWMSDKQWFEYAAARNVYNVMEEYKEWCWEKIENEEWVRLLDTIRTM